MNKKLIDTKFINIILIVIICIAALFQYIRSDKFTSRFKNYNLYEKVSKYEKIKIPENIQKEKYLIIYDELEPNSISICENVKRTLKDIKKDFEVMKCNQSINVKNSYDGIIFTFERLDNLSSYDEYMKFVKSGGNLIIMERFVLDASFNEIYKMLGIDELNGREDVINTRGVKMLSNVLIGSKGYSTYEPIIENSSLDVKLNDNVEMYMTSYDNLPMLWSTKYGEGKVIFFNGTMLNEKVNRGLITGILSLSQDTFIYPMGNMKLMYLDDFPAPIPEGINDRIYDEFNRDIPSFYREVWWSDMLKAAKKYDLKYTALIIEKYNNQVKPPFNKASKKLKRNLMLYGREVLKNGGELGIHGYNHQSLALPGDIKQNLGYKPWENRYNMEQSIKEVLEFGKKAFPYYEFRVYVPPSNILSKEGREALKAANPNLKIISSVFLNDYYNDSYEQEFEISNDNIIEIPRYTSGYKKSDEIMWTIYNGVTYNGVFSHFVHPDDVLDDERNFGKGWTYLYDNFTEILDVVKKNYPYLRSMTVSTAGEELIKYLELDPYFEKKQNSIYIYCNKFRKNSYLYMKENSNISKYEGCEISKIDNNMYLVLLKEPQAVIHLESRE